MSTRVRLIAALCAAIVVAVASPAAARAVVLAPAGDCPQEVPSTPFAASGDHAEYVLVGDGRFDHAGDGWTLRNSIDVSDNAPSTIGNAALEIHGSATSPDFCVGFDHPTIRFFARNTGSPLSALVVQVVVTTSLGLQLAVPVGLVANLSDSWALSPRMLVLGNLLMLAPGEKTRIALRFTPLGLDASWRIDDVYVDPYGKI